MRRRIELGDVLIFPCLLAFTRQYFWGIGDGSIVWLLSLGAAAVCWWLYEKSIDEETEAPGRSFWLIVALPLLIVFSLRVFYPDTSFDVINYHILHAERSLRGPLFLPTDFFPTPAPFNPAPDVLTGIYRHLLGYRLGALVNYFALVWMGIILDRLLIEFFKKPLLRHAAVLFILLSEQFLFQINNYMTELLALPLLLEAARLAIDTRASSIRLSRSARIALLIGISTAFKLSNLMFGIPIVIVFTINVLGQSAHRKAQLGRLIKSLPLAVIAFIVPLLPFTIYIYRLTGSPVFFLYNGIFHSPYWPARSIFDPRWGPHGLRETLLWPILVFFKPERASEAAVYSGRLSIGFVLAAICFIFLRSNRTIRDLSFITLLGSILWSASIGYLRYGLFLELTSGIIVVWFVLYVWKQCASLPLAAKLLIQIPLWLALLGQTAMALDYVGKYEWSLRTTIFEQSAPLTIQESSQFLRDRSLPDYLARSDRPLLDDVEVWIDADAKTSGIEVLLKPKIPIIGVLTPEYFATRESHHRFNQTLAKLSDKRMFALIYDGDLENARKLLAARGLGAGSSRRLTVPYFSESTKLDMLLVQVLPGPTSGAPGMPLPDAAFDAGITVSDLPATLHSGEKYSVQVTLRNNSDIAWPGVWSGAQQSWQYQITVGDRWTMENGGPINDLDGRTALAQGLKPGESVVLSLTITAPATPGNYLLEIDAVQESVAWFSDRGSVDVRRSVKVEN